jgi:hydrogenase maturation protease
MNGYDVLVVVDTVSQQTGAPGTVYVIEPEVPPAEANAVFDPHDLSPGGVMALLPTLGAQVERILVVGCQPESLEEGIGLTDTVQAAVGPAADLVLDVVAKELAAGVPR